MKIKCSKNSCLPYVELLTWPWPTPIDFLHQGLPNIKKDLHENVTPIRRWTEGQTGVKNSSYQICIFLKQNQITLIMLMLNDNCLTFWFPNQNLIPQWQSKKWTFNPWVIFYVADDTIIILVSLIWKVHYVPKVVWWSYIFLTAFFSMIKIF